MGRVRGRHGHHLLLTCLFGLTLLLGHHLVMATERHAAQMGLGHGPGMAATFLEAGTTDTPQPPTTWGECLGQNGVLPLLLLLFALAGIWRLGRPSLITASAGPWGRHALPLPPPPPEPGRRRALLQVFRN